MKEQDLVAGALVDQASMAELLRMIEPYVFQTAYYLTGSKMDGEDVAQDALWKICRSLHQFKGDSSFRTWVYSVVLNTYRDAARKKRRVTVPLEDTYVDHAPSVEETVATRSRLDDLRREIMKLNTEDREIFVLRHLQQLSYSEVAATMEVTEAHVRSRLYRTRQKLKHMLYGGE
ncbi:RNA polymerase sigma factor [Tumebacillus permanentifrigoris]|uniref:RNA polymerase sigma-70 factor (ECF subfamily) n=1 Tax=Tumebacillus permanentifrigoris TaxID=378543 RepID=A0A316D8E9_9BACL|nr:RNA polymerase sigma factor [Tumebacillus permanentifrigoris]PWK13123.1 RNA polymerase sigma-70 factor (ECF subfamily) [Tumebacillus permanentifrigoris]